MTDGRRNAREPFYIVVTECRPDEIDLSFEAPEGFDTLIEAETYLTRENVKYGVGGHVYLCLRMSGLPTSQEKEETQPVEAKPHDP